jgi:hypothetical protein
MTIEMDKVREEMGWRSTEELVEILAVRDEDEWRPEAFMVADEVLRERGISIADAVAAFREQTSSRPEPEDVTPARPDELVAVATLETAEEAQLCRMTLEQAGVPAVSRNPDDKYHGGSGGWEIQVDPRHAEAARAVLEAAPLAEDDDQADGMKCPKCGFITEPLREDQRLVCQVCGGGM